jgi:hypothetical protein
VVSKTHHVQHAAIVGVGQREAIGGHTYHDRLGVRNEFLPILAQGLCRVNIACPRFAVRVGNETRGFRPARLLPRYGWARDEPVLLYH